MDILAIANIFNYALYEIHIIILTNNIWPTTKRKIAFKIVQGKGLNKIDFHSLRQSKRCFMYFDAFDRKRQVLQWDIKVMFPH